MTFWFFLIDPWLSLSGPLSYCLRSFFPLRAVCGDCLVTVVVRTVTAITSTVGSGATVSTFSRRVTTPWRSVVKMTRRIVREHVRLEEIFNKNKLENRRARTVRSTFSSDADAAHEYTLLLWRTKAMCPTVSGIGGTRINNGSGCKFKPGTMLIRGSNTTTTTTTAISRESAPFSCGRHDGCRQRQRRSEARAATQTVLAT